MAHRSLRQVAHRPWPPPSGPWAWRQTWHDLLFLHWPIPAASLRDLVPEPLVIEEFEGTAWIGVTPFWMSGVTLRRLPALPGLSRFAELNVRTYVTHERRPGVWFFSLDAGSRAAVWAARRLFHLPYQHARMTIHRSDGRISYRSERASGAGFEAVYRPCGPAAHSHPGTLEHWLTERYCLYTRPPTRELHRAEIHHEPWPLQPAAASVTRNDMLAVHGMTVSGPATLMHYARRLDVVVWPLRPVAARARAAA